MREPVGAKRRLHLHFLHSPVAILGEDAVTGLRTERQELDGTGGVTGTGEFIDWDVTAVYRAVGYAGTPLPQLPFDEAKRVIPNHEGRVVDTGEQASTAEADVVQGVYATGWIKRGPVGLIGHTKGDALETIGHILDDRAAGVLTEPLFPDEDSIVELLESKGVDYADWEGYHRLETAEKALGEAEGRERVKIATREAMLREARDQVRSESHSGT
ncbi:hypothetical protein GCM10009689_25800 [Brevibacterium antiquum]